METVKRHVKASGSTTVIEFLRSDATKFDPRSPDLRKNIMKAKAKAVYDFAGGPTSEEEENAIRDLMSTSENSYEIIRMFGAIRGWDGLDDELPEGHLDPIARQLAQVLDQRDYVVYQLIRRYLALLDYSKSPNLGDCFAHLLSWQPRYLQAEFDHILSQKAALLKGITSATMRGRTWMTDAARVDPATVIARYVNSILPRRDQLVSLMHEANYTTRICSSLAVLDYQPLYSVITDMVDPQRSNLQRRACRDTCDRLSLEFAAAAKAVDVVGSNAAKATVNRFMAARKAALDNFPATLPAPGAIGAIVAAITGAAGTVAATLADLRTAITNLPDALAGAITLPSLTGSGEDDLARGLISELQAQGSLARLSFTNKVTLVNALLSGFTDDDDEIAIIRVMEAAKAYDQAELYQIAAAATWESLDSSFDGDEYDTLESILQQPT